ncbi:MAG: acyltransferase family protein [Pseudonocardiaceae bacterium]
MEAGVRLLSAPAPVPANAGPSEAPLPGTPLDSTRGEIRALTGLRLVAALWVLVFHYHYTPGEVYSQTWEAIRPLVLMGPMGVDLFFVLSGVVIAHTYAARLGASLRLHAAGSFLWARISRIWPAYAFVTIGFGIWLVVRAHIGIDPMISYQPIQPDLGWQSWVSQLLMVQFVTNWPTFNGSSFVAPGWSISAEWMAYLAFPLLVLLTWRLRRLPVTVLGALALVPLLPQAWVALGQSEPSAFWMVRIAGGFTSGVLVWLAVRKVPRTTRVSRIAAWVAVGALAEIVIIAWWADAMGAEIGTAQARALASLAFPVLIGALALSDHGPAALLGRSWAVHGGRISYSLYLIHYPIFEVYWTATAHLPALAPGSPLQSLVTPHVLLLSLLAAHLLWCWVEEPARLWLRARDPFRRVAAAAESESESVPRVAAARGLQEV